MLNFWIDNPDILLRDWRMGTQPVPDLSRGRPS